MVDRLEAIFAALDDALGDSDPIGDYTDDEMREEYPVLWAACEIRKLIEAQGAAKSPNRQITPCERHSCCNCGNTACPMYGVNCHKFVPRTA
jgi:hypothetical protein